MTYDELEKKANEIGFWAMPPTINEFLANIDMRKNIYDFWVDKLNDIYPDNIHVNHNYIMLTGAIGTGKSTMSKVMALYTFAKLLFMKNLDCFKIAITKAIQFVFFHVKMEKANAEFVDFITDFINTNHYFREIAKERKKLEEKGVVQPMPIAFVTDGVKSNNAIGGDVIFYVFSEANFVKERIIMYKIDQSYKRFKSRFILAMNYFGNIIIDTSSNYEGAVSDILSDKDEFYTVRASQWEVKPFAYFKKGYFYVFLGDGEQPPFIINNEEEAQQYPSNKIIKVPKELEKEFRSDIYDAIISLAGLSIQSPNSLFSAEIIEQVFLLENLFNDIEEVYNLSRIADFLSKYLQRNKGYFIHIDTSIRGDYTGIAIASWVNNDIIEVPFAIGIHNNKKDIPMYLIEDFIRIISERIFIEQVSADSYQSYKLLQDIERKFRIKTKTVSTDRNPTIYFTLKKLILDNKIKIVKNYQLMNELISLNIVQRESRIKIDHPSTIGKDVADAVASSVFECLENGKKNSAISNESNQATDIYMNYIAKIRNQISTGHSLSPDIMKSISKFT
ncbi:MAG: hypothetical protein QXF12_03510 [Candidatus Aenigmatarchaeota archaeon]